MKYLFILILSSLMVGCAAPVMKVDVPNIKESSSISVADLRPAKEKENEIFSLIISNEAYGTYRRGDALLDPTAIRIFQHRAFEKFSKQGINPDIKVHHLVVYMNLKSELRRGATGALLGGVIGAGIAASTQKYGIDGLASIITQKDFEVDEEYKRTLYSEKENPDKVSVYFVYIDAEINGKRVFIKTMTPAQLPKDVKKNPHVAAVETATAYFLDQYK